MNRKRITPASFEMQFPKLNLSKFWCCGLNPQKFGMRDQYFCPMCKAVYELNLVKVNRWLKEKDKEYLEEYIKELRLKNN